MMKCLNEKGGIKWCFKKNSTVFSKKIEALKWVLYRGVGRELLAGVDILKGSSFTGHCQAMSEPHQTSIFSDTSVSSDAEVQDRPAKKRSLAERMRARSFEEVVGQEHITGKEALLPRLIRSGYLGSLLFYGPPGCGKTTLAEVIAQTTQARFVRINAVLSNVAELRDVLREARYRDSKSVVFIDEIHRFNKAQQDLLLPDVEAGNIALIGATTHNPGFYIIPPLLSRSHLFRLKPIACEAIETTLSTALTDRERGMGNFECSADEGVLASLARLADGDLRRALNMLETLVMTVPMGTCLNEKHVEAFARERQIRYDANEDEHYDTASAFIKSVRGCDPDAALYWLAKMLVGGEDPRFIARRLVILASEDIGLADSRALPVAMATFQACEVIGLPECELNLAHCTLFLALSPKSNSATQAIAAAKHALKAEPVQAVPLHLRDSHTKLNKQLGHGASYLYSHDFPEAITGQDYLEKPLALYQPTGSGAEQALAERLQRWRTLKARLRKES